MGHGHSQLKKLNADFQDHREVHQLQLVSTNVWRPTPDHDIRYVNSGEVVLKGRFLMQPSTDNWMTFAKPPFTKEDKSRLGGDVFATVQFSPARKPIKLSIQGRELILAARESSSARISYNHKCIGKDDTWFTWSRYESHWYCFPGDLFDVEGHIPMACIRFAPLKMNIELAAEITSDSDLMLEVLVVGIAIAGKDYLRQRKPVPVNACSIM